MVLGSIWIRIVVCRISGHFASLRGDPEIVATDGTNAVLTSNGPLSSPYVLRSLKALLERAKLPGTFRVHDLRHTNATLLLEAGVNPRVVADRLGHAQVSITLDTYSHVTPNLEAQATGRLERAIYGEDESVS